MELTHLEDIFVDIGGQFFTSAFDLREKLIKVKAVVFDWDGVFNDGRKGLDQSSDFSEVDSLGVTLLRFGFFLDSGLQCKTAIISGESNKGCVEWAKREHIHAVYTSFDDKRKALDHFCNAHNLDPSEVIYFFDDVLDVPVAEKVGIRLAVGRLCNPIFLDYLEKHHLADYISSCQGHEHAVREFCELLLCLMEKHFKVIDERASYSASYENFISERNTIEPELCEYQDGRMVSQTT